MKFFLRTLFFLLFLLVLLGSLLVFAPAHFLGTAVAYWSKETIVITNAQGSLWKGQGDLWVVNDNLQEKITSLHWNVILDNIWKGDISLELDNQKSQRASRIRLQQTTWQIAIFDLPIPLQVIPQFLPKDIQTTWHDMQAGGFLTITALTGQGKIFNRSNPQKPLQGRITWENASLVTLPIQPIGSYRFEISIKPSLLSFNVGTLEGPLNIEGDGQVSNGQIQARFIMTPSATTYNVFRPMLRFWGKPLSNRRFEVSIQNLTQ